MLLVHTCRITVLASRAVLSDVTINVRWSIILPIVAPRKQQFLKPKSFPAYFGIESPNIKVSPVNTNTTVLLRVLW